MTSLGSSTSGPVKLSQSCDFCDHAKLLSTAVKTVLIGQNYRELPALKRDLRRYKSLFLNLLANSESKNVSHRAALVAAPKSGINFENESQPKILESDFVEESLILSDLFDLNEVNAAELLLFGESQKPRYPLWSRGLIAVVLYFDSKLSIIHSLKLISKAVPGFSWSSDVNDETSAFVENFVNELVSEGLVSKILNALNSFDVLQQFEQLRRQKALGDTSHRRVLAESLHDISVGLSEIICSLFCQLKMSLADALKIVDCLKHLDDKIFDGQSALKPQCVNLVFSLLNSFGNNRDETFIQSMHQSLANNAPYSESSVSAGKASKILFSILYLSWAVSLRKLSTENELPDSCSECRDEDEWFVDQSIAANVFENLTMVVNTKDFNCDEFRVRKLHQLMTDFIFYFPLKVRDLRNNGDEVARTLAAYLSEGISPPDDLINDYERCLKLMYSFYKKQNLQLSDDFWKVDETFVNSPSKNVSNTQRYLSLHKFCLSAADYIAPFLYVPVVDLLASLSTSEVSAWACVEFLFAAVQSPAHSTISVHHFFHALQSYYANLREERISADKLTRRDSSRLYSSSSSKPNNQNISPLETKGIESMLHLLAAICANSDRAVQVLVENSDLKVIYTLFGLITCKIPLTMKTKCMQLLSEIARDTKYAPSMWACLEKYQIIDLSQNAVQISTSGVVQELEEFETKLGCYDLSISFTLFVNKILKFAPKKFNLQILVSYLIDKLLNHFSTRYYANARDMYRVPAAVLEVIKTIVDNFEPSSIMSSNCAGSEQSWSMPIQIVSQLFKDSILTKRLFFIVDKTVSRLDHFQYGDDEDVLPLVQCCNYALCIVLGALQLQEDFISRCSESYRKDMYTSMDNLLQCLNSKSGFHDHLHNVIRIVVLTTGSSCVEQQKLRIVATEVLAWHAQLSVNQTRSVKYLLAEPSNALLFTQAVVNILEDFKSDYQSALNVLIYMNSLLDFPKATIAHYVLGLEENRKPRQLLLPSINGLHAITFVLDNFNVEHQQELSVDDAKIICRAYQILYKMSLLPDSCLNTLRLLQNIDWFLCRHVVDFGQLLKAQENPKVVSFLHTGYSWLVKTFSVDLKTCCIQRQQSSVAKMLSAIFERSATSRIWKEASQTPAVLNFSLGVSSMLTDITTSLENTLSKRKPWIMDYIMSCFSFQSDAQEELQVEYLDSDILMRAFSAAELDGKSSDTFDVRKLHAYLYDEVSALSLTYEQKALLTGDIEYVLAFASRENMRKEDNRARSMFLKSWCELIEVCLKFAADEIAQEKSTVMQILEFLCTSLNAENLSSDFAILISKVVLSILYFFRNFPQSSSDFDIVQVSMEVLSGTSDVLQNLLKFYIHGDSNKKEALCVNALSSILSYMRLFAPGSLEADQASELAFARVQNWAIVRSFGESFFRRLFSDSSLGHVVQKTTALSVFVDLLDLDENSDIANMMSKEGFIQKMVLEISSDNAELIQNLARGDPFDAIYLMNNAKFCLMSKLAQSPKGASSMVHSGFIENLTQLTFIDARPVTFGTASKTQKSKELVANQLAAHRQVFVPMLECCRNILTTLPAGHQEAANSVLQFIIAHFEVFLDVLSCNSFATLDKGDLKEISTACGVISAAAVKGSILLENQESYSVLHLQEAMRKLHLQLLKSLSVFGNLDNWDATLGAEVTVFDKESMRSSLISIISSLVSYVNGHTVTVLNTSLNSSLTKETHKKQNLSKILFFPSIVAPGAASVESSKGLNDYCNMGVLLKMSGQVVEELLVLLEERNDFKALLAKERYTDEEYARFSADWNHSQLSDTGLSAAVKLACHDQNVSKMKHSLVKLLLSKDEQLQALYFVAEVIMFVLYRHLDYYFKNFDPALFVKNRGANFKQLRQMLSLSSKSSPVNVSSPVPTKTKPAKNVSSGNSTEVYEEFSEEKIRQIKNFQLDTLQSLPPVLIDRMLNIDTALNELFSTSEDETGQKYTRSETFLSVHIKQIDRLLRTYAEKIHRQQLKEQE